MDAIPFEEYYNLTIVYGLPIIWALLILFFGRIVAKILSKSLSKLLVKAHVDTTITKFVRNLTYSALLAFVILAALEEVGVNTTSFAAVIAAAGLAIGFALQSSLSNFASGFMLLVFKPFKVGDFINASGVSGSVESIQLFTTVLKTPDNKVIIVPNGQITGGSITNFSAETTRRIDFVFGVSYGDDLKKVKEVLRDILDKEPRILPEPVPIIGLLELGDSSVNFAVRPWVNTTDYWSVFFDIQEAVKLRFDLENISIPFPQRDLHVISGKSNLN